jgi:prepilin-type N-terminal cleavage/methylation domain-containing protein
MNQRQQLHARGFTLMELLVVVGIMLMLITIAFPVIASITAQASTTVGINAVGMAGTTAQAYATRPKDFSNLDLDPLPPIVVVGDPRDIATYNGVAAIFTPASEIRITENVAAAVATNGRFLERIDETRALIDGGTFPHGKHHNGFVDVLVDYITLPSDAGVAGITRDGSIDANGPPLLLAPPFALWFDHNGSLVAGSGNHEFVYYNGHDSRDGYDITTRRRSNYNPDMYDPSSSDFNPTHWDAKPQRYTLPFERIETVVGVYVYSKRDFRAAAAAARNGNDFSWTASSANTERWNWMQDNARLVIFSRQSGTTLRKLTDR